MAVRRLAALRAQPRSRLEIAGRCLLLGDHTHVVKDGCRMPGVVSMREHSEEMALAFACDHERPAWLVLDAFFPTAKMFRLARSVYSIALQQPYLHLLVRAKKHYVAYFPAPPKPLIAGAGHCA